MGPARQRVNGICADPQAAVQAVKRMPFALFSSCLARDVLVKFIGVSLLAIVDSVPRTSSSLCLTNFKNDSAA
jgi:hypothetical protein